MGLLILYVVILTAIGVVDFIKTKDFDDYVVAGRRQGGLLVAASLLATIIGGSATIGLIGRAYTMGFPAFWWLGVGAIGLILQSIFLTPKVRELECYTLPGVAEKTINSPARVIIAVIILLSWIGIIAAQFVASGRLILALTGGGKLAVVILASAGVIILYALLGGQFSVLKTDFLQFIILSVAFVFVVIYLFTAKSHPGTSYPVELFNSKFKGFSFIHLFFIVGGSYFIGPDMFSRVFTARNGKTARRAVLVSGLLLLVLGAVITFIGVWAKTALPQANKDTLLTLLSGQLPPAGRILLLFGLLSAVISSTDTLLLTTASILEHDILKQKNVTVTRILVGVMGVVAALLGLWSQDIINLLLTAFSIFTPGVVMPLMVAILFYGKKRPQPVLMISAIVAGGVLGLLSTLLTKDWLALAGMGLSLVLALLSVFIVPVMETDNLKLEQAED